jgi:nickel-dependent lactate racemase
MRAAFLAATGVVDNLFAVPVEERADIVIAVNTPPLDIDFYQAQKAVENGRRALKEGGILIVVSACRAGVGNEAFLRLMREAGTPEKVIGTARADYHLGFHKASRLADVATSAEMWAVAGVDDQVARDAFMRPFPTVAEAVEAALAARPTGKVLVLMDAGITVPC